MPRKKKEELNEAEAVNEQPEGNQEASEPVSNTEMAAGSDSGDEGEQTSIVGSIVDTVSSVVESVAESVTSVAETVTSAVTGGTDNNTATTEKRSNRAQKIGIVTSDKMTKTVVVRVDRQVLHPKYRRYVRKASKFMAHDEKGAGVGDKVKIMETRPLSARKRWRVVEIIQKAAK
jgi:small subunit ribosomal protein S17